MPVFPRAEICGVGHYAPKKILTNDDLSKVMETSDEWIRERTGICQRHIADVSESTSDLATYASQEALKRAGWSSKDLDLILAATLSPDYYFPGIGVQIQKKLDANFIPALDIRGQCSGFSWNLSIADAFVRSGQYKKILVVGSEIHSRIIEFSNRGRNVSVLFGDAAGAVVIAAKDCEGERPKATNKVRGIIDSHMGGDGTGAECLAVKRPGLAAGFADFMTGEEAQEKAYLPYMDGKQVFRHATARMIETAHILLERNHITPEDVNLYIPHQANIRINEMVRHRLGVGEEKVFNNIHKFGNTTSATLPLCMYEAENQGRLKKGDLIMTLAFGAGFTWGGNLLRW